MQPQILQGFRDFLPDAMERRDFLVARLIQVFETFGFRPLQTPALEYYEVLAGKYGEEGARLMYHFQDNGKRHVGLRYDLTVPLARVVATHTDLPRPFRRYQIAPVWRAERPQKGRFREFWQCDVDVVGSASMLIDAELAAILQTGMLALGFSEFEIHINNRKLLNAAAEMVGLGAERVMDLCRSLDKLDKIGQEKVEQELQNQGVTSEQVQRLFEALTPQGDALQKLDAMEKTLGALAVGRKGVDELRQAVTGAFAAGVQPRHLVVDPVLARGLDYYTGNIFETTLTNLKIGTVAAGGRYDGLIGLMGGQAGVPAAGVSFGLDRLLVALEEMQLLPSGQLKGVQALVTLFNTESAASALGLAAELRQAGIRTELYTEPDKLGKQFKHADRLGAVLAIVEGPDERAAGKVTIKNLKTGVQQTIQRSELVIWIKQDLALAAPHP